MEPATLVKQMRITLVCPGHNQESALVTLTRTTAGTSTRWIAATSVEQHGETVACVTAEHSAERSALVEIAEWLRGTFGIRTTCLGSTVTIVAATAEQREAA